MCDELLSETLFVTIGQARLILTRRVADRREIHANDHDSAGRYTTNIGNGTILAFEATIGWRPSPMQRVSTALIATRSALAKPAFAFQGNGQQASPDTSGSCQPPDRRTAVVAA